MMEPVFNYDKVHLLPRFARETLELSPDKPDPTQFLPAADHMAYCILEDKDPSLQAEEGFARLGADGTDLSYL